MQLPEPDVCNPRDIVLTYLGTRRPPYIISAGQCWFNRIAVELSDILHYIIVLYQKQMSLCFAKTDRDSSDCQQPVDIDRPFFSHQAASLAVE